MSVENQIQIELINETPANAPENNSAITKYYEYDRGDGKIQKVTRTYVVKHDKSFKNKGNKEIIGKYVEEHKEKYIALPRHQQVRILKEDVKKDLNLELSQTGATTLLVKYCNRKVNSGIRSKKNKENQDN